MNRQEWGLIIAWFSFSISFIFYVFSTRLTRLTRLFHLRDRTFFIRGKLVLLFNPASDENGAEKQKGASISFGACAAALTFKKIYCNR